MRLDLPAPRQQLRVKKLCSASATCSLSRWAVRGDNGAIDLDEYQFIEKLPVGRISQPMDLLGNLYQDRQLHDA